MRDVVVDEMIYIEEKKYQKIKEETGQKKDYFYMEEIKKYSQK